MQALLTCKSKKKKKHLKINFLTQKNYRNAIKNVNFKSHLQNKTPFCKSHFKRMIEMKKAKMRALNHTYKRKKKLSVNQN
jgi:hypothetical protein